MTAASAAALALTALLVVAVSWRRERGAVTAPGGDGRLGRLSAAALLAGALALVLTAGRLVTTAL